MVLFKNFDIAYSVQDQKCKYDSLFNIKRLYNNEDTIGRAIKEALEESNGTLKREDLFITSKVWNTFHSRDAVRQCLNETLTNLNLDYVDCKNHMKFLG